MANCISKNIKSGTDRAVAEAAEVGWEWVSGRGGRLRAGRRWGAGQRRPRQRQPGRWGGGGAPLRSGWLAGKVGVAGKQVATCLRPPLAA